MKIFFKNFCEKTRHVHRDICGKNPIALDLYTIFLYLFPVLAMYRCNIDIYLRDVDIYLCYNIDIYLLLRFLVGTNRSQIWLS